MLLSVTSFMKVGFSTAILLIHSNNMTVDFFNSTSVLANKSIFNPLNIAV